MINEYLIGENWKCICEGNDNFFIFCIIIMAHFYAHVLVSVSKSPRFESDWNSALAGSFQSCSVFRGNLARRRRRLGEIWFSKNNLPIMFVEIAYCSAIGPTWLNFPEITQYLNVFGWVVAMWALALGVTKISHKLYYDLLTSTGGRDLIMFWEIHSHKNGVSTVFGPTYDSFILDNIMWRPKASLYTVLISDSCFSPVIG